MTALAMTPRERLQRADEKRRCVIGWIARHGFINVAHTTDLLELQTEAGARVALARLARAGLLELAHVEGPARRPNLVATLTPEGIATAETMGLEPVVANVEQWGRERLQMAILEQKVHLAAERAGLVCRAREGELVLEGHGKLRARLASRLQPRAELAEMKRRLLIAPTRELADQLSRLGADAISVTDLPNRLREIAECAGR